MTIFQISYFNIYKIILVFFFVVVVFFLGEIPLRQLVYRVHPLPESMKPLVWDFGQLDDATEALYTREIVENAVSKSNSDLFSKSL